MDQIVLAKLLNWVLGGVALCVAMLIAAMIWHRYKMYKVFEIETNRRLQIYFDDQERRSGQGAKITEHRIKL